MRPKKVINEKIAVDDPGKAREYGSEAWGKKESLVAVFIGDAPRTSDMASGSAQALGWDFVDLSGDTRGPEALAEEMLPATRTCFALAPSQAAPEIKEAGAILYVMPQSMDFDQACMAVADHVMLPDTDPESRIGQALDKIRQTLPEA